MLTLAAGSVTPQEITVFLLSFGVLLGTARLFGEIAKRFGQPTVLGEILAGVVLGNTILASVAPGVYDWLFPSYFMEGGEKVVGDDGQPVYGNVRVALDMFLTLCVAFLLLVAGLEVDLSSVWRQGKAAVSISITGMVFPFAVGALGAWVLAEQLGKDPAGPLLPFVLFIGIAMSITALPVIAKILLDLNMLKSDLGMLIMSAAMVNDLLGWIGFAIVLAMIETDAATGTGGILGTIGMTLLFVGGMLTVGRWLAHRSLPYIQAHTSWPGGVLGFVLVVALLCAALTEWIGIHSIFGAFIAGVAIGDSKHLRQSTRETIEQFITYIFAPVFFASIGLRVDFVGAFDPLMVVLVLVIAIVGKLFGCYLGAKWAGMSPRESWATGFGMCARGAMEIILGQLALSAGLITEELFVAIVIMALVTSIMPGPAMQWLLQRQQKKTLADLLSEKHFVGRLKATTRRAAIRELADQAAAVTGLDATAIAAGVWQRETIMSTGLEHGIAVPHANLEGLKKGVIIVGRSEAGIDFDATDNQPSHLICMLLTPASERTIQIELLNLVAHAFATEQARAEALEANSYTEFRAALSVATEH